MPSREKIGAAAMRIVASGKFASELSPSAPKKLATIALGSNAGCVAKAELVKSWSSVCAGVAGAAAGLASGAIVSSVPCGVATSARNPAAGVVLPTVWKSTLPGICAALLAAASGVAENFSFNDFNEVPE